MITKICFSKWQAAAYLAKSIVPIIVLPLLFKLLFPDYRASALFVMIALVIVFGINITMETNQSDIVYRSHMPMTGHELVLGSFLFQVTLVAAGILTSAAVVLSLEGSVQDLDKIFKVAAAVLIFAGLTACIGFLLPSRIASTVMSLLFIILMSVSMTARIEAFFSFAHVIHIVVAAVAIFLLFMIVAMLYLKRKKQVA